MTRGEIQSACPAAVRYDGPWKGYGLEWHAFTIDDPGHPANEASFSVKGEPTAEAIKAEANAKRLEFERAAQLTTA